MSKVGRKNIEIPDEVDVEISREKLVVKGPKGERKRAIKPEIKIEKDNDTLKFTRRNDTKKARSLHGLYRTLTANMIEGVINGYEKKLDVIGVGYKVDKKGDTLYLELGHSHAIAFRPPAGIEFEVETPQRRTEAPNTKNELLMGTITIKGIKKELVGNIAEKIRSQRPPSVYSGKGVRYKGETVHLKAGKAAF